MSCLYPFYFAGRYHLPSAVILVAKKIGQHVNPPASRPAITIRTSFHCQVTNTAEARRELKNSTAEQTASISFFPLRILVTQHSLSLY